MYKLKTYRRIKKDFCIEPYLLHIKSKEKRMYYARLRTSCHILRVETGRHARVLVPFEDRKCTICNSDNIEDEQHFLLSCKEFEYDRMKMTNEMCSIIPQFNSMTGHNKLSVLLSSKDCDILEVAIRYINVIYDKRNSNVVP